MINYQYCPQCKNKLESRNIHHFCPSCNIIIYTNPKPCASVLPIKNEKVLLSKRAIAPHKGEYDLIGGFVEIGETIEQAAIREAKEETGLDVKLTKLLGTYSDQYGKGGVYTINIQYLAEIVGGKIKAQEDVVSLHWVPIDKLPKSKGFRNTRETLRDLRKWYQNQ